MRILAEYRESKRSPILPRVPSNPESYVDRTGVLHEYGLGVVKDQHRAVEWHTLAAKQGLADSEYHLGLMKAHGRGFSQDFSGAAIHFQKASVKNIMPVTCYMDSLDEMKGYTPSVKHTSS